MCTFYRSDVLGKDLIVEAMLRLLRQCAHDHRFAIHAYCFIPHEVSLLLEGLSHSSALRRFIRDWKQRTTLEYRKSTGRELWQRGHIDQTLHAAECTGEVARYVMGTPVRNGLVATASEYRYSGSDTNETGEVLPRKGYTERNRPGNGRSDPASTSSG
jgi:REP element-mobilizing transposase RayT